MVFRIWREVVTCRRVYAQLVLDRAVTLRDFTYCFEDVFNTGLWYVVTFLPFPLPNAELSVTLRYLTGS